MSADSVPSQVSSWACLVVVLWVCACVVHPIQFTFPTAGFVATHLLPRGLHGATLHLSSATAPPMGVLVLRLFDVLPLGDVVSCLISVGEVKPWQVLLIFFTLAYASISVDVTGLSKFIAIRTLRSIQTKSPGAPPAAVTGPPLVGDDPRLSPTTSSVSGIPSAQQQGGGGEVSLRRLLVVVYLLSGVIALIASNDVVVLTLTPVLIHFCQSWNVDPIPVLLVEYYSANTWSAFLEIGNPTNIILGQGLELSFIEYFQLSVLPTVVTIATSLGMIALLPLPAPLTASTDPAVSFSPPPDSDNNEDLHLSPPSEMLGVGEVEKGSPTTVEGGEDSMRGCSASTNVSGTLRDRKSVV